MPLFEIIFEIIIYYYLYDSYICTWVIDLKIWYAYPIIRKNTKKMIKMHIRTKGEKKGKKIIIIWKKVDNIYLYLIGEGHDT